MNRATRELEWTSLRTGGESKREGISRKRRATVGDVRVVRIVRDGESVWVLWRLTWMWLRTFGLMSSLRPQAEKIRASLQPFAVSYTHLTLPTTGSLCRSRWSPYH